MKTAFLFAAVVLVNSNAFGIAPSQRNLQSDDNSLYPVVIACIMIAGGIMARLLSKRKAERNY
jgi:hypothetical protein